MAMAADCELNRELIENKNHENRELIQELDVLKEIYITELSLNHNSCDHLESVDVQLHPSTGENVEQKWVCLTLRITPSKNYPQSVPEISIRGPRGLADEHIASLRKSLYEIAEERKGTPMMYELIEFVKDSLTKLNIPYGSCMICLEDFNKNQKEFTKTDCYHYFHCTCLAIYLKHCKKELEASAGQDSKKESKQAICPVCREVLRSDLKLPVSWSVEGESSQEQFVPSVELQIMQQKMADLYEKQKQKGGIINLEEEKNKYLLPKDFVYVAKQEQNDENDPLVQESSHQSETEKKEKMSKFEDNLHHGGRRENMKRGQRGNERREREDRQRLDFEREDKRKYTDNEDYGRWNGRGRWRGKGGREDHRRDRRLDGTWNMEKAHAQFSNNEYERQYEMRKFCNQEEFARSGKGDTNCNSTSREKMEVEAETESAYGSENNSLSCNSLLNKNASCPNSKTEEKKYDQASEAKGIKDYRDVFYGQQSTREKKSGNDRWRNYDKKDEREIKRRESKNPGKLWCRNFSEKGNFSKGCETKNDVNKTSEETSEMKENATVSNAEQENFAASEHFSRMTDSRKLNVGHENPVTHHDAKKTPKAEYKQPRNYRQHRVPSVLRQQELESSEEIQGERFLQNEMVCREADVNRDFTQQKRPAPKEYYTRRQFQNYRRCENVRTGEQDHSGRQKSSQSSEPTKEISNECQSSAAVKVKDSSEIQLSERKSNPRLHNSDESSAGHPGFSIHSIKDVKVLSN